MVNKADPTTTELDNRSGKSAHNTRSLIEGEDYYWEGPYMVFTARFLLRRGYCCGSGCRHCPFEKPNGG
jgi:Family of unknown function (DUF5522)